MQAGEKNQSDFKGRRIGFPAELKPIRLSNAKTWKPKGQPLRAVY